MTVLARLNDVETNNHQAIEKHRRLLSDNIGQMTESVKGLHGYQESFASSISAIVSRSSEDIKVRLFRFDASRWLLIDAT